MAAAVADRQEDRDVTLARLRKGTIAPFAPIYEVFCMLEEVPGGGVRELVHDVVEHSGGYIVTARDLSVASEPQLVTHRADAGYERRAAG